MNIDKSIFKSYDIRGIYPDTINEEIAKSFGTAFVNKFDLKKVAIGRDGRVSSPSITKATIDGITSAGADVIDFGILTTDMSFISSALYDNIDGTIMVTASHNPGQYNGYKVGLKGAVALSGETGIFDLRDMLANEDYRPSATPGRVEQNEMYQKYQEKLFSIVDTSKIKPLKVVIDAGNGVAGYVLERIFKDLPIEIIPLYFEVDGTFPNHQPSPIEEKNQIDLKAKVIETNADLGLAFDGDGDRVYFVDENGKSIDATISSAMIAKKLLQKYPGGLIIYNVNVGWIVPETVEKYGGKSMIWKVGHSHLKQKMREEDGIFACEHSGHYFFKDLFYADSGILASLVVLELISEENKPISQIAKEFDKYFLSGEINTVVKDQKAKIAELKEKYSDGDILEIDGLKVEYPEWKFIVRGSNTEPLLRLNVEAKTKELMEEKRDELLEMIRA